ncbi:lipoprotein [Mycoplasma mycoides]|uniref:lipoprotein n=1 Tax=Mycoplasma mycoides TaxID=2102 RepID=UPI002732CCB5|nr:lipoprotein [Mycoplasma mycoides]MDP4040025.1 lipoprotein [Mycoplasma mycoides]MDP4041011.1 lipoprotein [Mycoplasma mycoides]MDP4041786.1 lipoprotein [Mycoplasma mycoides]MDP4043437.1 lipoprotein [Mycoplasma mycoides]MDP4044304.1 lipoprotein [Mycoplasma mycoides]
MKKLLTILGSVGLVATSGAFVIACGDKTKMNDAKSTQEEKIDLNKLIKVRDLGFVSKNDKDIIKSAFIKQNGLNDPKYKDKVEVEVKTNGNSTSSTGTTTSSNGNSSDSATVTLKNKGQNGNGSKTVTVIFDVNNNLKSLVKVTKLKSLPDNKDETILAAVSKANPKSNLDVKELKIERTDNKVFVKSGDKNIYTDKVELQIESKVGVYVGLSLLSVALLASSAFIIYRSVKKKKKQM